MAKYISIRMDITTVDVGVILHGCNCSGAFGSGVAGAIRRRWPQVAYEYDSLGLSWGMPDKNLLGSCQQVKINDGLYVLNGFTQFRYGGGGVYADPKAIQMCMISALDLCLTNGLDLYIPKIGCGLGGLNWETEVEPIVDEMSRLALGDTQIRVCDI